MDIGKVIDDLASLRSLLESQGRSVGTSRDEDGGLCLWHAMMLVVRDNGNQPGAMENMVRAIFPHLPVEFQRCEDVTFSIISFNDRTVDDQVVYDVLDKAVANL